MEIAEIIYYIGTLFLLISYCCKELWLRIFQLFGCIGSTIFAILIFQSSPSARGMIISNCIFLIINIVVLIKRIKEKKLNFYFFDKCKYDNRDNNK